MTNAEAIEIIRDGMEIKRHPKDLTLTVAEVEEAKQMAISALEQKPCEDAVSRELVLREIDKYLCGVPFEEGIDEVIKHLPSVERQTGEWIPVSERLPEERKAVLVYAPEYKNIYCAYLDGDTWFILGGYGSYAVANVIAWMPLPEPYME